MDAPVATDMFSGCRVIFGGLTVRMKLDLTKNTKQKQIMCHEKIEESERLLAIAGISLYLHNIKRVKTLGCIM